MSRVHIEFDGSSRGAVNAAKDTAHAIEKVKKTTAETAQQNVAKRVEERRSLEAMAAEYRKVASAAKRGSEVQIAAVKEEQAALRKLSNEHGVHSRAVQDGNRHMDRFARGALAGTGLMGHFGRSIAFASSAFLGTAGFVGVLKLSIGAASDLHEQLNKVDVVFGKSAGTVKAWSKDSATAMGIAQHEALGMAATFGNMLVPMGFARKEAASMSTRLVQMASDMASFNNADPSETLAALQSGLAGQVRPLRQFGVFLDQARIKAVALADGIVKPTVETRKLSQAQAAFAIAQDKVTQAVAKHGPKSREAAAAQLALSKAADQVSKAMAGHVPQLTAAQKAMATYKIILKDTKDTQGDFARTSGGLANQQRILKAQLTDLSAELGTALLPTITKYLPHLTGWITKNEKNGTFQRDLNKAVKVAGEVINGVIPVIKDIVGVWKDFRDAVGGTKTALILIGGVMVGAKVLGAIKTLRASVAALKADMLFLGSPVMLAAIAAGLAAFEAAKEIAATKAKEKVADKGGWQVFGDSWEGHKAGSKPFIAKEGVLAGQRVQVKTINGQTWVIPTAKQPGSNTSGMSNDPVHDAAGRSGGGSSVTGTTPSEVARSAASSPGAAAASFHLEGERAPWDCSAFTQAVFKKAGIGIGGDTYAQFGGGRKVEKNDLQADDLVFFNYPGERSPGHVGIYVGGGMMVHDHGQSRGVSSQAVDWSAYVGARCYIAGHVHATTSATDPTTGGGFHEKPKPPKKPGVVTGTALLSSGARIALAKADTPVERRSALVQAREELEKLQKTASKSERVPIAEELGRINKQIQAIDVAAHRAKMAAIAKQAQNMTARVKEAIAAQKAAWDQHVQDLQQIAADAKTKFEDQWSQMAAATLSEFDKATSTGLTKLQKAYAEAQKAFAAETNLTLKSMAKEAQRQLDEFDRATQAGLAALGAPNQTPEEQALADFRAGRAASDHAQHLADLQKALTDAQAGGDPAAIKAAQDAINQQALDDQEAALQAQADASRKAADQKAQDDQAAYQAQRDAARAALDQRLQDAQDGYQQERDNLAAHNDEVEQLAEEGYQTAREKMRGELDGWLEDQKVRLETGKGDWETFFGQLVTMSDKYGINAGAAFQAAWLAASRGGAGVASAAAAAAAAEAAGPALGAAGFGGFDQNGKWVGGNINTIQIPGFASGGVVGAPRPRTVDPRDTIMARLRPGEVVLTPEQAAAMQAGGETHIHIHATVVGTTDREVQRAISRIAADGIERHTGYTSPRG